MARFRQKSQGKIQETLLRRKRAAPFLWAAGGRQVTEAKRAMKTKKYQVVH